MADEMKLGDGRSAEDWRKLLYFHAVQISKAKTKEEIKAATAAAKAITDMARLVGFDVDSFQNRPAFPRLLTERLGEADGD